MHISANEARSIRCIYARCLKRLNLAVHYAIANSVPLVVPKLEEETTIVVCFSDA